MFEFGSSFEDAVASALAERWAKQFPDRYVRPGEFERDGLHGNPDLLDMEEQAIVEIKLTWMSARHDPESVKFWKYWTQAVSYAAMVGWLKIYLHVGHINGDYSRDTLGPNPIYNVWQATITEQEREATWLMIRKHRKSMAAKA